MTATTAGMNSSSTITEIILLGMYFIFFWLDGSRGEGWGICRPRLLSPARDLVGGDGRDADDVESVLGCLHFVHLDDGQDFFHF